MSVRLRPVTQATLPEAPPVCQRCVWWQSKVGRSAGKERWMQRAEEEYGPWGSLYYDDGRALGMMQYGPAELFPRAAELPGGPPSEDAVLVTCAYVVDRATPWVLQSPARGT